MMNAESKTDSSFIDDRSPLSRAGKEIDRDPNKITWMWKLGWLLCRPILALLFQLKTYRRHYVPRRGGVLLVSNHQSYLDPVLVGVYLPRPMSFLAKSELFRNRLFSWLIRSLNAFPVRQGAGDVGAVKEMIKRLREGHMLNIFPEGSRTENGEMGPMEPGAALVVRKAGVPIVPCVVDGSFKAWPKGQKFPKPHRVSVMFGPPLQIDGLKAQQITQLIDQTLRSMLVELRQRRQEDELW
jgi:1-acyl-sn-glycerol-3-phosphate acyltransferase